MREHGLLNRVLLIYDEHLRMLAAKRPFDGSVLVSAADVIRHFVEEYHEKLEEDFLFPRFRKAGKLLGLVDTLQAQHKAGRELTAKIRELAGTATFKYVSTDSDKLADALREFLRMYRPHEAREDTVLFPAFRTIVSVHEYDSLGDDFEKKEDELFGDEGFFKVVDQVAQLEKRLGIYELAQFTPK
jgi:hemerythrin-like domain-containing protein